MANLKLETFPNKPKKLKRRKTGTLRLHKKDSTREQTTDFNCETISNSDQILVFPKSSNDDINCNEETSKINLNLSLNSFEFTFQFPGKLDTTRSFEVISEADIKVVNDDNIGQDTDAIQTRVKSIMKNSNIENEGKEKIRSETYKKVSFLEGLLKETTNSLNDTSIDTKKAITDYANIRKKQYPATKKSYVNPLINKSAILTVENATVLKDPQSDFNQDFAKKITSDKSLSLQNSLNDHITHSSLSYEGKQCSLASDSDLQEVFEPEVNHSEEHSLFQNLFEPNDHLNETRLLNGTSVYSSDESFNADIPYSKTKLVYDQEIKNLDTAIRDLKIQRKKLAMKRRANKWNSFFWFAMPRKENFVRHSDNTISDKYPEENVAKDLKTQRKHRSFLSYRSPVKTRS